MNDNNTFRKIFITFLLADILVALVYVVGRQRKPMIYKYIPDQNKEWINDMETNHRFPITNVEKGPYKWDNDKDLGAEEDWLQTSDDNFIVYYKKDEKDLWRVRAERTLKWANDAIPKLELMMGKYYYASDMNGRKLAIYLPDQGALYASLINRLMGQSYNSMNTAGICINQVGPLGCQTKGIIIHPDCYDPSTPRVNGAKTILFHEMNHYVYFSSLNYSQEIDHPLWVPEGMAELFCGRNPQQIISHDSIEYIETECDLCDEFPSKFNASYWAGESFFRFVKEDAGDEVLTSFLKTLFNEGVSDALTDEFSITCEDAHSKWVSSLQKYSPYYVNDTIDVQ